jgi:hypothetical protein
MASASGTSPGGRPMRSPPCIGTRPSASAAAARSIGTVAGGVGPPKAATKPTLPAPSSIRESQAARCSAAGPRQLVSAISGAAAASRGTERKAKGAADGVRIRRDHPLDQNLVAVLRGGSGRMTDRSRAVASDATSAPDESSSRTMTGTTGSLKRRRPPPAPRQCQNRRPALSRGARHGRTRAARPTRPVERAGCAT